MIQIARSSSRRRGMALMLVLMAVATVGVMTYALCAATQMRTQIAASASVRVQAEHLAESGLNLAMYYLQNPTTSPVALVYGTSGNVHYPGESPLVIAGLPGSLSTTVTNPSNGTFLITSTATLDGVVTTATATTKLDKSKTFDAAVLMTGNPTLNSKVTIAGGTITNGTLTLGGANLSGSIVALNGASLGGSAATAATPTSYPVSLTHYLPTYFYDGKTCTAKSLQSNVLGVPLVDPNTTSNPANMWYVDSDVTFFLTNTFTGTLAVKNGKKLTLSGNLTITPLKPNMPALIADGNIVVSTSGAAVRTLQSNGVTYIGGTVSGTGLLTNSKVNVNGVLLAPKGGWPFASSYTGQVNVTYDAARATVAAFADEIEQINTLRVQSWEISNGRP
jgi:Tfp pilus assembly protein PilX